MIAVAQEINWTSVLLAFFTALPACLVAWAGLRKASEAEKKTDKVIEKTDTIIEKAVEIHSLANSQLSTVTKALEVANEKINGMEKLIANFVGQKSQATEIKKGDTLAP